MSGGPNDLPDAVKAAKEHVTKVNEEIKAGGSGKAAEANFEGGKTAEGISQEGKETPPGSNLDQFLKEPVVIHLPDEATDLDKAAAAGAGGGAGKAAGKKDQGDEAGKDHKYDVLKGKYDTEIPKLNNRISDLEKRLTQRDQLIQDQQLLITKISEGGGAAAGSEGAAGGEDDIKKSLKKIDVERMKTEGFDELVIEIASNLNDVVEANTALQQEKAELVNKINVLENRANETTETVARTASNTFWANVTAAIPNWYEYNGDKNGQGADERWANFLNGFDPKDMKQYRVKAAEAIENGDHTSMINIVRIFETLIGNGAAGGAGSGAGEGAGGSGGQGKSSDELEALVSHKKSGASGAGSEGKIPTVTEEDMAKARSLLTAGKISTEKFREILNAYHATTMRQG